MTLTANTWIPVGPAPIQDPIRGRLSYPENWGDTLISGAVNGLAMVQGENGDGFLYIGAVNGGVWMRPYTYATDSWGEWTWQSKPSNDPNSGYQGIQSIAKIAVSPDNQYLAVGQGNPSNFNALSSGNSKGLQIAKILEDGSLEWLILNPDISNLFVENTINIRDLDWVNDNLFIATLNQLVVLDVVEGEVSNLRILTQDPQQNSFVQVAHNNHDDTYGISLGGLSYIDPANSSVALPITGDKVQDFYRSLGIADNFRLSAYPELVNGQTVLFVGTSQEDKISVISRLVLNGSELIDFETVNVQDDVGSGQGGGGYFYGNFSFVADPQDSLALRVLAGGNQYGENGQYGPFTGGVVAIEFQPDSSTPQLVDWFGPRDGIIREEFVEGTAPHADSRSIVFYATPEGLKLIESDDGGIFQKGVDSQSPWTSLSGKGLQTLESRTGDWSNIGNQLISAIQDNSVAMGSYGDLTWTNVYAGDGSLGFFDDASYQGDGFSRAYYASQQYMSIGYIALTTFDETGTWQSVNNVFLSTFDYDGNEIPILFFEGEWFKSVHPDGTYPFGLPANSNPYRAGDIVFTGTRNIYEAVIPHWEVDTNEILLMPLLPESFESNSVKDFTALDVGSSLEEVSSFEMAKPYSWDDLYTAYYDSQTKSSYLMGRNGSESSIMLDPNSYQLQLIDSVQGLLITDITHYSDSLSNTDNLYYLATETSVLYALGKRNSLGENNRLAVKIANNEPIYYTYQELGLEPQVNLQTITLLPATDTHPQQLVVGGLGGLWISDIDGNGQPSTFSPMNWDGLPENIGPGSWNLDLQYDPVDDVLIANMLGHGAWIWSRSGEIDTPPEPDFGFSITSSLVPQSQSNFFDRRGRSIDGAIIVQLHRTPAQLNQDITAELVLNDPSIWQENIGLYADVSKTFDLTEGGIFDNQIRIPLTFVAGVDTLTFEFTTKRPELVLPDITATMEVVSNDFPDSVAEGNITLFPNGVSPSYYETSTSGVFYNFGEIAGSRNITAMMPSSLPQGTQVGIYGVNKDGSITDDSENIINVEHPDYIDLALENSLYLAVANNPQSNLALNSEKALNAFIDGTTFVTTEAQRYGNVQQADIAEGFTTGDTFAFSLRFPDGTGLVSVGSDAFTINEDADNTVIFNPNEEKLEVGLAPAGGGVFAAESSEYTLNIARLGRYNSGYGLFRVDTLTGDIDGLSPGTNDYAVKALERALSNGVDGFTGQNFPEYGQNSSETITGLSENSYYATFITPNQTINEALELLQESSSLPSNNYVNFSIQEANQGIIAALPMGTGFFAFEDMGLTGDNDFNDVLLQFIPNDSIT